MTALGTAAKVYAGSTAAVAVYAGSVKVWPTAAPQPPAGIAVVPDAQMKLHVDARQAALRVAGDHQISLQLTQPFRDFATYAPTSSPAWVDNQGAGLTVTSANFSQIVAAEHATRVVLRSTGGLTLTMVVTP
jgi:hypothetical protein